MPNRLNWAALLALVMLQAGFAAQSTTAPPRSMNQGDRQQSTANDFAFPIPSQLLEKWRKYGQWDYKQQGARYRDYTLFNLGATGSAAGIPKDALVALSNSSKPKQEDVDALDSLELQEKFSAQSAEFEKLRNMVEMDSHLIRIAPDFTWVKNNSKWPREDLGISQARWNDYRAMFKKLSLPEGIFRTEDYPGTVFFIARAKGLCTGGTSGGYAYSTEKLGPIVKSVAEGLRTESKKDSKRHYAYVFQSLKDNWYTFYEVDW